MGIFTFYWPDSSKTKVQGNTKEEAIKAASLESIALETIIKRDCIIVPGEDESYGWFGSKEKWKPKQSN